MSITRLLYLLTMAVCLFTACKKSKSGIEDELIARVKEENPDCTCDPFISKFKYKGTIVYMQGVAGPACSSVPIFYSANGEQMDLPQGMTYAEFIAECIFIRNVWSCKHPPYTHQ